jgi:hypothetical protein
MTAASSILMKHLYVHKPSHDFTTRGCYKSDTGITGGIVVVDARDGKVYRPDHITKNDLGARHNEYERIASIPEEFLFLLQIGMKPSHQVEILPQPVHPEDQDAVPDLRIKNQCIGADLVRSTHLNARQVAHVCRAYLLEFGEPLRIPVLPLSSPAQRNAPAA